MKKLIYLFLVLVVIACSKDDSSESQTFFQKYDGVVWQENQSDPDFTYRIQFNNATPPSIKIYEEYYGSSYCDSELVESNGELTEISEDGFTLLIEYVEDSIVYSYSVTFAVSESGNQLTITDSDDPGSPETYSRTILNDPCQ